MGWKVIFSLLTGWAPRGLHDLLPSSGRPRLYLFSGWRGVASAAAEGLVIETFGSVEAFSRYFGGYTTFGSLENPNQFLCVWGGRGAKQFRGFLLERFEDLEVILAQPPAWPFSRVTADRQLTEDERAELERTFTKQL